MTGSDFPDSVFSLFTFKLGGGTGWYIMDEELAENFVWGKGEGCKIA